MAFERPSNSPHSDLVFVLIRTLLSTYTSGNENITRMMHFYNYTHTNLFLYSFYRTHLAGFRTDEVGKHEKVVSLKRRRNNEKMTAVIIVRIHAKINAINTKNITLNTFNHNNNSADNDSDDENDNGNFLQNERGKKKNLSKHPFVHFTFSP